MSSSRTVADLARIAGADVGVGAHRNGARAREEAEELGGVGRGHRHPGFLGVPDLDDALGIERRKHNAEFVQGRPDAG